MRLPLKLLPHDSFSTMYFSRLVADQIVSKGVEIRFFRKLISHIEGCERLAKFKEYENVYLLSDE